MSWSNACVLRGICPRFGLYGVSRHLLFAVTDMEFVTETSDVNTFPFEGSRFSTFKFRNTRCCLQDPVPDVNHTSLLVTVSHALLCGITDPIRGTETPVLIQLFRTGIPSCPRICVPFVLIPCQGPTTLVGDDYVSRSDRFDDLVKDRFSWMIRELK
ncbi:hypothetical protein C487_00255 [Natrinema pallidum DSM 3751]|uniref:Uncharacterized protein n=1 Tax=Natrinema pallidum DSM 3751 TaxID=1227495 RepID=L9ZDS1_9EURY|nr:hypothetical protein C487_00255 [Natrinema pallidum DSM 3751]